jgi:hypothetical protein
MKLVTDRNASELDINHCITLNATLEQCNILIKTIRTDTINFSRYQTLSYQMSVIDRLYVVFIKHSINHAGYDIEYGPY